jgi:hypothetical protein
MRGLVALVWGMGILILVGIAVVAVTIVQRSGLASRHRVADVVLGEPPGTHISGVAPLGDRLAVTLSGGGPDRVAIIDLQHGSVSGHISLAH